MDLRLYDTLTKQKRTFAPIDASNVRMYVCGPTVYDFAHIGNARPAIVFDVLFRLLRHRYGADHVTYVRNITDVDDKINDRALRDFPDLPLNEAIRKVTEKTEAQFHADVDALGCLRPTVEPRATDFVLPRADGKTDMVTLIAQLIDRGHAYVAGGEVLFDTQSMPDYGALSGRRLDEQKAGARVAVDAHKKNPADFVLWKGSSENEPGWDSPWGRGRPGWHIECSAMSAAYLGTTFDIHGGGLDLIFPHHENEIAQSRCAHGTPVMANIWMHNGFLQVEGEKMSKSTGNFVTIRELLETDKFGGRKWPGEVLRFAMLQTSYREPIDWTVRSLEQARSRLKTWKEFSADRKRSQLSQPLFKKILDLLFNDLDTPAVLNLIDRVVGNEQSTDRERYTVYKTLNLLGFTGGRSNVSKLAEELTATANSIAKFTSNDWIAISNGVKIKPTLNSGKPKAGTELLIAIEALRGFLDEIAPIIGHAVDAELVNKFRNQKLEKFSPRKTMFEENVVALLNQRSAARANKDFKESDRVRDVLLAMGVVLKDGKDVDGKPITTWEIAR